MKQIDEIHLYSDFMGRPVSTPVLQAGNGSPNVVMTALQHGWEIIGLDTALQVMQNANISGTITLIPVCSPMAYSDGARITGRYMGPSSKQVTNMNRVHPGLSNGNIAERSSKAIDEYISALKPDFLIDLHSYASQSLPHAIVDNAEPETLNKIYDWVKTSKNIWYREYEGELLKDHALDRALSAIWVNRGVPAITLELGPINLFSPKQAQDAQIALTNTLIGSGAIKGNIIPQKYITSSDQVLQRAEIISAGDKSGYLRPLVDVGKSIGQGTVIAEVVTPNGDVVDSIKSPEDGIMFVWHDEYRVAPGSLLGVILVKYK
jgi:predicted deacylase